MRIFLLAERYISSIEEAHPAKRSIVPHAATFFGRPQKIKLVVESSKSEAQIEVRT